MKASLHKATRTRTLRQPQNLKTRKLENLKEKTMKVLFKNMLKAYSGECDGLVYYYNSRLNRVMCRRHVIPKATPQNAKMKVVAEQLKALQISEEYITDLKYYAAISREHGKHLNWRNVFMKLMYAMQSNLEVDLATITREQIFGQNLPCKSVKSAIDAGLLDKIVGYQRLSAEM